MVAFLNKMFSVSCKGAYFKRMINWIIIQRFYQTIFDNLPLTLSCLYPLSLALPIIPLSIPYLIFLITPSAPERHHD